MRKFLSCRGMVWGQCSACERLSEGMELWQINQPPPQRPQFNKSLIAVLIKGNQWFIDKALLNLCSWCVWGGTLGGGLVDQPQFGRTQRIFMEDPAMTQGIISALFPPWSCATGPYLLALEIVLLWRQRALPCVAERMVMYSTREHVRRTL